MNATHLLLLLLSLVLYSLPFLFLDQCWYLIFIFPIPFLYTALNNNLSFYSGCIWGFCVCLFHSIGGIFVLMYITNPYSWMGLGLACILIFTQAFVCGLLFYIANQIIELYCFSPLKKIMVWTVSLMVFIQWLIYYSFWIGGVKEGYPLINPLLPLTAAPQILHMLPIIGQMGVIALLFLISSSFIVMIHYRNSCSVLFFIITIIPWIYWYNYPEIEESSGWHDCVKSLPHMALVRGSDPIPIVQSIALKIKRILYEYPTTKVIIMPESSFNNNCCVDRPEALKYLSSDYLGKPIHIVCGVSRYSDNKCYNSFYWIYNGIIQSCYDKTHTMLITERLPFWLDYSCIKSMMYKNNKIVTMSANKRQSLSLLETVSFMPYLCSEFFFKKKLDDSSDPIVLMVNDSLFSCCEYSRYMQQLLLAVAQMRAIEYKREIVYASYSYGCVITKNGIYSKNHLISPIFYILRARPELVEGYPRALEDTLQQVQGERKIRLFNRVEDLIFAINRFIGIIAMKSKKLLLILPCIPKNYRF